MPRMISRVASSMPASRPLAKYDRAEDQAAGEQQKMQDDDYGQDFHRGDPPSHQKRTNAPASYHPRDVGRYRWQSAAFVLSIRRAFPQTSIIAD